MTTDIKDENYASFPTSTNVKSARFDPASGQVAVEFKSGDTYTYGNFTRESFTEFTTAKSPGGWFHSNVRSNPDKYPVVGDKQTAAPTLAASLTPTPTTPAPSDGSTSSPSLSDPAADPDLAATNAVDGLVQPPRVIPQAVPPAPPVGLTPGPKTAGQVRAATRKTLAGTPGSDIAKHVALQTGEHTAGIAAANEDGKAKLTESRQWWKQRPWRKGPNGTTSPAK